MNVVQRRGNGYKVSTKRPRGLSDSSDRLPKSGTKTISTIKMEVIHTELTPPEENAGLSSYEQNFGSEIVGAIN